MTPSIYQIKRGYLARGEQLTGQSHTLGTLQGYHYFDRDTLRFFGQTLKDFKVRRTADPKIYETTAKSWGGTSRALWRDLGNGYYELVNN